MQNEQLILCSLTLRSQAIFGCVKAGFHGTIGGDFKLRESKYCSKMLQMYNKNVSCCFYRKPQSKFRHTRLRSSAKLFSFARSCRQGFAISNKLTLVEIGKVLIRGMHDLKIK
jgi:hypothetical protein